MSTGFETKHAYFPAKSAGSGGGDLTSPNDLIDVNYRPTQAECALLTEPIGYFLSQCTCYDMMGMSTQVVVLDVDASLAVAFIAAQETRVQSCVLWDPRGRQFVGVLSSTDYIKILLYCEAHPAEAERVSAWSIRHWREVKDTVVNPAVANLSASVPSSAPRAMRAKARPSSIITCQAQTTLKECLAKMKDFGVRRIVALAEKEGGSYSAVAMMDVAHIVEYLGVMFFHIERSGGTLWHHPSTKSSAAGGAASGGGGGGSGGLTSVDGPLGAQSSLDSVRTSDSPSAGGGGQPSRAGSAAGSALGGNGGGTGGRSDGVFTLGETLLPPHVSSILSQVEASGAAAMEPRVGPYCTLFDIPFRNLPQAVGVHRENPIFVTMDSQLNEALRLLLRNDIESIAVCTPDMIIVDVISRSDLLRMENQGVYDTSLTVREALASKISEQIFVIYAQDTLRDIFAHFVRQRVKELFFVDPDTGRLQGQLNVTEFAFFLVFAHMWGEEGPGAGTAAATK